MTLIVLLLSSCLNDKKWKGQEPIKKVSTKTVPIQLQYKGTFDLGNDVYCSNDFAGARLNGVARTNDTLITALITAENTPINMSPWYAFKVWSEYEQKVYLKLTYPKNVNHRYYPKISNDGTNWHSLDSVYYDEITFPQDEESKLPKEIIMELSVNPDTLWIAAQEVITTTHINKWINQLDTNSFVTTTKIGESHEGRPIRVLKIGDSDDSKMIIVLSRQHPPEVTGFLAMQSFVETLCSNNKIAFNFRQQYNTYVIPVVNPDGVDNGHWRHNNGGVDLNRDWQDFNQPETSSIRHFMKQKLASTGGKFYFFIDFHSTWEDIYYTIDPSLEGNMPGLVPDMIKATGNEFHSYEPNIRPSSGGEALVTSSTYFFYEFGAESLVYEIGDHTPRDFVRKKGEVSAMKLMELMIK